MTAVVLLCLTLLPLAGPAPPRQASAPSVRAPAELREDPPTIPPPKPGSLRGVIAGANEVATLSAVSRLTGKRYAPAAFDRAAGSFTFDNLPGDARYDVCITTADGGAAQTQPAAMASPRRVEGIDLDWVEARLDRLAAERRRQLGLEQEPPRTFTAEDAAALLKYLADLKDFTDTRRALFIRGHGDKAVMLVEVMRTTDFYAKADDQIIWRTELWYFAWHAGGWERQDNTERVLERLRIPLRQWQAMTLVYEPALSGYVDPLGRSQPIRYDLSARLDPAKGRLAGTEFRQATRAIVLGLPEPVEAAGSGPATRQAER